MRFHYLFTALYRLFTSTDHCGYTTPLVGVLVSRSRMRYLGTLLGVQIGAGVAQLGLGRVHHDDIRPPGESGIG